MKREPKYMYTLTPPTGTQPAGGSSGLIAWVKARRVRVTVAVVLLGGLAFAAGWNPPTNTVHTFTEMSDYNARRDSGCTNSGEGCHGDDANHQDFNAYHPETDCTVCHEYEGVGCIPCHGPAQHECTGCHDGTMEGALDCVRLSDPYPRGHYRSTTHQAMGTDMTQVVRSAEGGEAQAACKDCHSRDLKEAHTGVPVVEGSDYGTDIGCGECHNDERSGSVEQVTSKWKRHRCEDCHAEKSAAPMHAADVIESTEGSGTAGCGETGPGCHEGNDLHALHPDTPKTCSGAAAEGEPACHDLDVEAHAPETTACGGEGACHAAHRTDAWGHKDDQSLHFAGAAQRGDAYTDRASGVTTSCGACHSMALGIEHARPNAALGGGTCRACHNDNDTTVAAVRESWPKRDTAQACAECHGSPDHSGADSAHVAIQIDHTGVVSETGCVKPGCHLTADVRVVHKGVGCAIEGCHTNTGDIRGDRILTCGGEDDASGTACHTRSERHAGAPAAHVATQYDHTGAVSETGCVRPGCHPSADVRVLHEEVGACYIAGCHVEGGPTLMSCGGTDALLGANCHTSSTRHLHMTESHTGVEADRITGAPAPGSCVKPGCHATTYLRTLHEEVGCAIEGCHVDGGPGQQTCGGPDTATNCHTSSKRHAEIEERHGAIEYNRYGDPETGACAKPGCHATADLRELHHDVGCYIAGCHVAGGPGVKSCGGPDSLSGTNCHTASARHADIEAKHNATQYDRYDAEAFNACVKAGCHATNNARDLHHDVGCYIAGCHVEGGPTLMACGGTDALIGTACHTASSRHLEIDERHTPIELGSTGAPQPGACTGASCHATVNLLEVHHGIGCYIAGCHVAGGPGDKTCGGPADTPGSCHTPPPAGTCIIPDPPAPTVEWKPLHATPAASSDATASGEPSAAVEPPADGEPQQPEDDPPPDEGARAHDQAQDGDHARCLSCHEVSDDTQQ